MMQSLVLYDIGQLWTGLDCIQFLDSGDGLQKQGALHIINYVGESLVLSKFFLEVDSEADV